VIFATVGMHTAPFDRFVTAVDTYAATSGEDVLVQVGGSTVRCRFARTVDYMDEVAFASSLDSCDLLITHGGDTILEALRRGIPTVAVPRRHEFSEIIDNHQVIFCKTMALRGFIVYSEPADLGGAIGRARARSWQSHHNNPLAASLRAVIASFEG
jgi:UDP-N-acetylglucosamine transferase subunit ALG13